MIPDYTGLLTAAIDHYGDSLGKVTHKIAIANWENSLLLQTKENLIDRLAFTVSAVRIGLPSDYERE
ncbi:MAG: hypothetical protein IH840_07030 [Candidatus Heimdallarchaeota archaeon]|nr:hypothetical protein [Candidatus Heimdallarchaeota archaeon]